MAHLGVHASSCHNCFTMAVGHAASGVDHVQPDVYKRQISFYVALQGSDPTEFFEPALILLIVILNAIMGTVQESKAERSLEALQNMSAPHARVRRDGQESLSLIHI